MFKNLKIQILFLFLLVSIISLILFGSFTQYFGSRLLKDSTLERSEFAVLAMKHEFEKGIDEAYKVINVLEFTLFDYLKENPPENKDDIELLMDWLEPTIRQQAQSQNQSRTAYIYINPELYHFATDIYYADQDGDGNVSRQSTLPYDYFASGPNALDDKAWWFGPIEAQGDFWTQPYDWVLDNGEIIRFISLTRPIYYEGQLFAVIGTDLAYEIIEKRVQDYAVYNLGTTFLLDAEGKTMIPNDITASNELFDDDQLLFTAKLTNQWTLGISTSREQIYAPLWRFQQLLLVIGLAVIFCVSLLSLWFSKSVTAPLKLMEDVLHAAQGNLYDINLPESLRERKDEIGALARALTQMNQQLQTDLMTIEFKNLALNNEQSKRKNIETRLQLITKTLEHSDNGIFITDENYRILYTNKTFHSITGYQDQNLDSDLLTAGIFLTDKQKHILSSKGLLQGEFEQKRLGDRPYPMQLYITRIVDEATYYLGLFKDISEQKIKDQHLNYLRFYDFATQLPNKVLFQEKIDALLQTNTESSYVCLLINIDNFRILNGLIGTEACDQLIKQFSDRLLQYEHPHDLIARTEGDEFGVFFHLKHDEIILNHLTSLKRHLTKPYLLNDELHHITVSFGFSCSPENGRTAEELLKNASIALNHAKNNGKNQIVKYEDAFESISAENYELLKHMRFALEQDEMFLHFQPQINVHTKHVVGVEALLRWKHDDHYISPNQFIPLAEQTRLIIPIGEFVLKEAFKLAEYFYKSNASIVVAVNISAVQLKWDFLFAQVMRLKQVYAFPNENIEFEVTESLLITNEDEAIDVIIELKRMGFMTTIDDFGTGYASLSYLKRFPFERIKIDRNFIKDYPDTDDGSIAKLIINLAKNMNIEIVAEGIETIEQLEFLKQHDCHIIQGYYFAKPLPKDDLMDYIHDMNHPNL
ncbi:bifunctional diguanylate cyclase/phosphodiesterase [Petrocella sp. FN5]|uniref:bifunctional diguanylate cyclase/phosphodiesterase n=1 Tax=Petrocella sp. FN5 TaxID=3032002 RepID=UPI0023DAF877|nr:EAL domain-containing protein [Petrocella sp. FN5]MDF1618692.1 EAL domain-containing protein [Petrocella sp. FN5]